MHRMLTLLVNLAIGPSLAVAATPPRPATPNPTVIVTSVHPKRIEVGSVIEVEGKGFTAEGAAPTLRLSGYFSDDSGLRQFSWETKALYESPRRIVHRVTYEDFEKMGKLRGEFRGHLHVFCPTKGGAVATGTIALRARMFPPTVLALAEEIRSAGVVTDVNRVLVWILLGLGWLALTLLFVRLILFSRDRAPRPGPGAPPSALGRWLAGRMAAATVVLFISGALAAVFYALSGPLHGALDSLTGLPYAIHLGLAFLAAFVLVNFALLYAGPITWVERRVAARMQSRVGPNRVGPQGILQWLADGFKAVMKEDVIPTNADPVLFRAAPYLVFSAIFATFAVLPFSATWVATDLNVGILFVLSVTSIVVPGLLMAGWSSNNKWSLFGGMRAAAQIVSYEIPASLAVLTVIIYAGSLSMQDIVRTQGGAPWNWFVFQNPFTLMAFFLFFTSQLAEGNRAPFDLPEAESELVSGYNTEYSGMRFLLFFVAEYVNIYVMSAIATTVFLGGWRVPLVSVAEQEKSILWQLVGLALFWAKVGVLSFVVIWIRWTLPRLRVDQLMVMCWKYFVPLAFVGFVGSTVWYMLLADHETVDRVLRTLLFLCGTGIVSYLFYRSWWNFRHTKAQVFVKPWI